MTDLQEKTRYPAIAWIDDKTLKAPDMPVGRVDIRVAVHLDGAVWNSIHRKSGGTHAPRPHAGRHYPLRVFGGFEGVKASRAAIEADAITRREYEIEGYQPSGTAEPPRLYGEMAHRLADRLDEGTADYPALDAIFAGDSGPTDKAQRFGHERPLPISPNWRVASIAIANRRHAVSLA
jgi:hypothetical protein